MEAYGLLAIPKLRNVGGGVILILKQPSSSNTTTELGLAYLSYT